MPHHCQDEDCHAADEVTALLEERGRLREQLKLAAQLAVRAERDRDEYRDQVHTLAERCSNMTSAASSAAASTVTAIERIQALMLVIDPAVSWYHSAPGTPTRDAEAVLAGAVATYLITVGDRS